ncbi:MAG: polysaccharide pyruvyl transferase family protein, partial [Campylobacterales bacterium]|nr:polysaccharide pyruvyl transferase family protein [Campylobacterales bacterium]
DGLILIGGSVFQDLSYSLYRGYIGRYLTFKRLSKLGKKSFVIGANLGPFNTFFGKNIIYKSIKHASSVCVRDKFSYDLLNSWGLAYKSKVAPDFIFGYDYQPKVQVASAKNILGISILNTKLNPEVRDIYIHKMSELINAYLEQDNTHQVRLFGFDGGHENDGLIIDLVLNEVLDKTRVTKIEYNAKITIEEYLELFLECGFMIANRFHSMVLAAKYNIPFYPIIYSKKTSNVLSDMKYQFDSIEYANIAQLDSQALIKSIMTNQRNFILPESYSHEALNHFYGLDNLK